MNQTIKNNWVSALREGFYRQGKYQLRDLDDHYDAVGVLMDLASIAGVIPEPKKKDGSSGAGVFFGWLYDDSATRLTKAVEDWSGLPYWTANRILTMNDEGKTFEQIAKFIEKEL